MNAKLKTFQLIHFAFCVSILLFAFFTIMISRDRMIFDASFENTAPLNPIFPLMGLTTLALSIFLFKKFIAKIEAVATLNTKITHYQTAFIVGAGLLEAGALPNIVAFLITKMHSF